VHDLVRLERRGIATAGIGTEPFVDEALLQARVLGMPDLRLAFVPHPVQLLSADELAMLAERAFPTIVALLTGGRTYPSGVGR
jgi:hypothetical protein